VSANLSANSPRVMRAGFVKSGISGQNRMIEMHRSGSNRVYWKSYDFLASNREAILSEFPLGPASPDNPFSQLAFKHDDRSISSENRSITPNTFASEVPPLNTALPRNLWVDFRANSKIRSLLAGPVSHQQDALVANLIPRTQHYSDSKMS